MKLHWFTILLVGFFLFHCPDLSRAQNGQTTSKPDTTQLYLIIKHDGSKYVGKILYQDAREVLLLTETIGEVVIPKHTIKSIEPIDDPSQYDNEDPFSTRYFISTNGLPISEGNSYVQWNLFGPDFQFAVKENFGLGIMTSWMGVPIIGTAKYSMSVSDNVHLGLGTLLGTGSWSAPEYALALPFAALTFGDRLNNVNVSGGYGALWTEGENEGRPMFSVGGILRINEKVSLVFDSILVPKGKYYTDTYEEYDPETDSFITVSDRRRKSGFALLIPGIRWKKDADRTFQFGFASLGYDGSIAPFPLPMVQWFRRL